MGRHEWVRWLLWHPDGGFSILDMHFEDGYVKWITLMQGCARVKDCDSASEVEVMFTQSFNRWVIVASIGNWSFWGDDHIANAILDMIERIVGDMALVAEHVFEEID